MEAAVAYFDATGKRKLLDVAIRLANHIDTTFRLANKPWFSGHQEIELALVKLYRTTQDDRYLKLADWYLQQRGHHYYNYKNGWITPEYWQEEIPVKDQQVITGHAVRAMYMYTGAADVGALTGDEDYMKAMKKVWEDVVDRNMYITGGIGSAGTNEGFSHDYDLPNQSAYCETCASVGMVFWNQRMAQLSGDSKYIDVLEKSLYNAALDGLSLSGDRFFYDNPLASDGKQTRSAWFGTACCPANISRLVASLGNYVYGKSENGIWINLFVNSNTSISMGKNTIGIQTETSYPWDGNIRLKVDPVSRQRFTLYLRLPGWAQGRASPGDLYAYTNFQPVNISLKVNGKPQATKTENGYVAIVREWKKGDVVEYDLPMQILKIKAIDSLKNDADRVALQRGPFVYCVEGADNQGQVWDMIVPENIMFHTLDYKVVNERVVALQAEAKQAVPQNNGAQIVFRQKKMLAIPYYTWANRGANPMQVWLPEKVRTVSLNASEQ
jgi:DUF1680 family protein